MQHDVRYIIYIESPISIARRGLAHARPNDARLECDATLECEDQTANVETIL